MTGIFFLFKEYYILAIVEMLNVPFTIYGFYKWKSGIEKVTRTDSMMSFVAISVVIVYFIYADSEILETTSSGAFLIGGLLVARNKKLGWYINIMADIILVYILFESSDYLFVCFQMLSIYIALRKTIFKSISKKGSEQNSEPFFIYQYIQIVDRYIHCVLHSRGTC
ncbi:nicotinamide mononucleotide transporter [Candidatus Nomurabacteria bacterium]|nr:nicotinamide mononucleotide transporter [Candidatus Nomurabacteria bacterium]